MKNITKLTALEVGHAYAIGLDGVATILTELESEELPVEMVDTTVFTFELKINISLSSILVAAL
jgi:hypothetical protein